MSTKLIALAAGATALIGGALFAATSANALPPLPAKQAATTQVQQAYYNRHARPHRVMSQHDVRTVLRRAGYHHVQNIRFDNHYVVRGTFHGRPSMAVYRGPAYVATATAPNGQRYRVAVNPRTQQIVGRTRS